MKAEDLRAVQASLKERYMGAPVAALVTLRAEGRIGDSGVACNVETGRALVEAGLHPATGGDGSFACSGDMLLQALVACAGVTLKAVVTALDFRLDDGRVTAGKATSIFAAPSESIVRRRSAFVRSVCASTWTTDEPPDRIAAVTKLTERYCVVLQTLRSPADISLQVTTSA